MIPGDHLGHYAIIAPLGAGGMGEVYRARDERLGREVAIKILPEASRLAPDALARFTREARAVASLSHPNIVAVHHFDTAGDTQFLVMELLDGEPLSSRLSRGPLAPSESVEIGIQVADALAAAHERGVVHRDLKPSNIFLTTHGGVKVLDFGLARSLDGAISRRDDSVELKTATGMILGTPGYMSPEQVSGEPVDGRTDIFSLGCVLYEMLTGRSPFCRPSANAMLAAVLLDQPTAIGPGISLPLASIVTTCLEKRPDARYASARALADALRATPADWASSPAAVTLPPPSSRSRRRMAAANRVGSALRRNRIVVGLIVLAATTLGWVIWPRSGMVPATQWERITDYADAVGSPALSSDGRMVAFLRGPRTFTTFGDVYVMMLPKGPTLQVTHDDKEKMDPVFSPDGRTIAYTVPLSDTWTVPVTGGTPQLWLSNASGLTWADTNALLFSEMSELSGRLDRMRISTSDASRTRQRTIYTPVDPAGMAHRSAMSPDHHWVLVTAQMVQRPNWVWLPCRLVAVDGGAAGRLVGPPDAACTSAAWSTDGKWMYFSSNAGGAYHIWRQRFPNGHPQQVTSGPTDEEGIAMAPDGKSLITAVGTRRVAIVVHDSSGDRLVESEGRPGLARPYDGSPFSPDGTRLYYLQLPRTSNDVGSTMLSQYGAGELMRLDRSTGASESLFPGLDVNRFSLAPDGSRIAFVTQDEHGRRLWTASLDHRSAPRFLANSVQAVRFTKDYIYFFERGPGEALVARRMRPDGSGNERIWDEDFRRGSVSPSGSYLALTQRATGDRQELETTVKIVEWQSKKQQTLCTDCFAWWTDDGRWLALSTFSGSGEAGADVYLLPTRRGTELPELPPGGFARLSDTEHLPGARIISGRASVALGRSPDVYAFVRETVNRNLYRIPLR